MINVVIIDSGVDLNHPAFSKDTIVALSVNDAFSAIDEYGHGTAVYGIIRKCPGIKIIGTTAQSCKIGKKVVYYRYGQTTEPVVYT